MTIRTVKQVVSCYVNDTHDNWDEVLPDVVFTYNKSAHSSTGVAPNQIIFSKLLESPTDRRLNIQMNIVDKSSIENRAAENIRRDKHQQKHQYDKRVNKYPTFNINDLILLENTRKVVGHVASFEPKLIGQYQVVEQKDFVNYKIIDPQTQKTQVVHVNRMHHYASRKESISDV